jgi:hypothetical protein
MSEKPHACSLSPGEKGDRAAEFHGVAARALVERERSVGMVRLSFRDEPEVRSAVEDLAARERECCPFLDLDVALHDERVTLTIGAAAEDRAALDAFYELAA